MFPKIYHISSIFMLSTLVGCNGGGNPAPDVFNQSSSGQCQNMVTGTQCNISFQYNNYGQHASVRLGGSSTLPSLSQCQTNPSNGCGIIYDGSFTNSFNTCQTEFSQNTGSGSCSITFTYTSGVSNSKNGTNYPISFVNNNDGASTKPTTITGN